MQWGRWHTALPLLPWSAPVVVASAKTNPALREANEKPYRVIQIKATKKGMKWRWRATSFHAQQAVNRFGQRQQRQRHQQKPFDFDRRRPIQSQAAGKCFYSQWRATGAVLALRTGWPCAGGSAPATRRRARPSRRWQRGTWTRSALTRLSRPLLCVQGSDQGTAAGAPGLRRWWCPVRGFCGSQLSLPRLVSSLAAISLPRFPKSSRAPGGAQVSPAAARSELQGKQKCASR